MKRRKGKTEKYILGDRLYTCMGWALSRGYYQMQVLWGRERSKVIWGYSETTRESSGVDNKVEGGR